MKKLTQLVSKLNQAEVRLIRSFYKVHNSGRNKLRLDFFDAIHKGKVKDDEEACINIYGKKPFNNYYQLKGRLKNDIISLLLLQDSKIKSKTPFFRAKLDCRKYLTSGELLLNKGAYLMAMEVLTKALKLADEFELYTEMIMISMLLISFMGNKSGMKYFNLYKEDLDRSYEQLGYIIESKKIKEEWALPSLTKEISKENYLDITIRTVDKLKANYSKSNSPQIGYWYFQALMNYYLMIDKPDNALESAIEFLELVKNSKSIYSNANVAMVNFGASVILLNMCRYQEGAQYAKIAVKKYGIKEGMANELRAMETLFLNLFYGKEATEAKVICKRALNHKQINSNDFLPAKWLYYIANVYFINKEYEKSYEFLQKNTQLMKDRTGWLLGYKMLEMLNLIELNDYDLFSYRLETFGKLLQHIKDEHIERMKLSYKLLKSLYKHGYDFKKVVEKESAIFEQLQSNEKPYDWRPDSYELIRVEEYILSKVKVPQKATVVEQ